MSIKQSTRIVSQSIDVAEQRRKPRFELTAAIPARISGVTVRLIDVSATGAQIEHPNGFRIGSVSSLVIDAAEPIELLVRVIWSHFAASAQDARRAYCSGVAFEGDIDPVAGKLGRFLRAYGRLDRNSLARKRELLLARSQNRSPVMRFLTKEEMPHEDLELMIREARQKLASDPQEALKWYNRAKFALAERFDISATLAFAPRKQEVLAVWEYLGRRVEVSKILQSFEKRDR